MMQEFIALAKDIIAATKATENTLRLAKENLVWEEFRYARVLGYKGELFPLAFCGHGRHGAACGTWEVCSYIPLTFIFWLKCSTPPTKNLLPIIQPHFHQMTLRRRWAPSLPPHSVIPLLCASIISG